MKFKRNFFKYGRPDWLRRAVLHLENRRIAMTPFYQRNHYAGHMSLHDVDHCCVVDDKASAFYHRIPKNANLSLVTSMRQLTEGQELATELQSKRRYKASVVVPSSLTQGNCEKVDSYFRFFVVRNPYDRTLSAYLNKIVGKATRGQPTRMDIHVRGMAPTFRAFCEFLAKGGLYTDHHFSPQSEYLVYPIDRYDFIARFETLNRDFEVIANQLGYRSQRTGMVAEDKRHSTGAANRRTEFYTGDLYELVYDIYRRDFEAFGYDQQRA